MRQKLIEKFDWIVYRLAYKSINRMCTRSDGAYAYLFKLSIEEWLEHHPLSERVKDSAETFHRSLREYR